MRRCESLLPINTHLFCKLNFVIGKNNEIIYYRMVGRCMFIINATMDRLKYLDVELRTNTLKKL